LQKQPLLPGWLSALLSVAFVLSAIAVLFFSYLTVQHLLSQTSEDDLSQPGAVSGDGLVSVGDLAPVTVIDGGVIATPTAAAPVYADWEGSERINFLVMGIDRRPGEAFVSRTDSLMVISVNPQAKTASVLSLPRDLYVQIPGYGQDRINTALVYGALNGDYLDGAALAMQTVSYNLNVPVHHFVMVDFGALTRAVDLLGGITVDVPYTIDDPNYPDMNYGFDPLFIPAGLQKFDGALALKYARTRHADSDFNRAYRQQQVLFAMRDQALSMGVIEFLRRAPSLYREVESGVRTDLNFEQLLRLAKTVSEIPRSTIRSGVIDNNYVTSYRTPAGASVLLLNQETALPFVQSLFAD
jgi:polyisoprenyl-teichoic acid--peptidoglycan teichoic acid transferase